MLPTRRRPMQQVLRILAVATGFFGLSSIPAQTQREPAGLGVPYDLNGVSYALGFVPDAVLDRPWRTDTLVFSIDNFRPSEYKVTMAAGSVLFYSWTASADVHYEFHGHSWVDNVAGDAALYRHGMERKAEGVIAVPLDGIHGWYFRNSSIERPTEIVLRLAGDYTLEPGYMNTR